MKKKFFKKSIYQILLKLFVIFLFFSFIFNNFVKIINAEEKPSLVFLQEQSTPTKAVFKLINLKPNKTYPVFIQLLDSETVIAQHVLDIYDYPEHILTITTNILPNTNYLAYIKDPDCTGLCLFEKLNFKTPDYAIIPIKNESIKIKEKTSNSIFIELAELDVGPFIYSQYIEYSASLKNLKNTFETIPVKKMVNNNVFFDNLSSGTEYEIIVSKNNFTSTGEFVGVASYPFGIISLKFITPPGNTPTPVNYSIPKPQNNLSVQNSTLTSQTSQNSFSSGGLVECTENCGWNELLALVNRVINFILFRLAIPIAAIMFAYTGILLLTSGGDSSKKTKAKEVFSGVAIGLVVAAAAWLIVHVILSILGYTGASWIGF